MTDSDGLAGGSQTQQSGDGTAPSVQSVAGEQTHGEPGPEKKAPDLDEIFRKGYRDGQTKGRSRLIRELGFRDEDELRDAITPAEDQDEQNQDLEKAYRELKEDRRTLRKDLDYHKTELARYQVQAKRALQADVRSRLLRFGAHPESIDDLVSLILPRLAWSSDGSEMEVVDRSQDGGTMPSRLTVDELIEAQRSDRPWFFSSKIKSGAGSQPFNASVPDSAAPADDQSWKTRYGNYLKRNV